MKATKMRNRQIYFATMKTASKQLSGKLSKDLRKKYNKRSVRIVEGDSVKVVRGEFTGVDGKVTEVSRHNNGLTIEGVKKEKLKGEKFDVYIHTTNIEVTALNTDDKWRINKLEGKNVRAPRPETQKRIKENESKKESEEKPPTKAKDEKKENITSKKPSKRKKETKINGENSR